MKSFVKSALFAGLGVGCLALGSGAQQPPTPPAAPLAPLPFVTGQGGTTVFQPAQGAYPGRLAAATADGTTRVWYTDGHDLETVKLAKQIADAKTDTEKDKLKEKLKEALTKSFDARQKRQETEIEALKAQVKKLEEMVAKRQEAKKEIIAERIKQLELEAKGLGW